MRFRVRWIVITAFLLLATTHVRAGEIAVLQNGFVIRYEHRQIFETVTRLYFEEAPGSYVDIPTDDIVRFEIEEPLPRSPEPPARNSNRAPLSEVISSASTRNGLDPQLVTSVIRAESAFDSKAVSPKGARGLMQLMPVTAWNLGVRDPLDPEANVEGGTRYLRQLLDRYSDDLIKALAAYNAGPKSVDRYHGVPPYAETRAYVARILNDLHRQRLANGEHKRENPRSAKVASANSPTSAAMPSE